MGLLRNAFAVTGYTSLATTASWLLLTRQSHIQDLPPTDYLLNHTLTARYNPSNAPVTQDICVRRVPLSKIKPELLAGNNEGKLVEAF
ncbi:hypothetical protein LTR53_016617, partial [Teratosphaeriaceae sp. CCFEE 6253]